METDNSLVVFTMNFLKNNVFWPAQQRKTMDFFFLTSLLAYNCFTMVCQFQLYNKLNQLYIYIYLHISSLLSPSHPPYSVLLGGTKHRADVSVLCGCFPLAIYFTFGSIYKSMPLSHFVPAFPSPSLCPQDNSLHLRLYCSPAHMFLRTFFFFLDSIYIYISVQYLFFSF